MLILLNYFHINLNRNSLFHVLILSLNVGKHSQVHTSFIVYTETFAQRINVINVNDNKHQQPDA